MNESLQYQSTRTKYVTPPFLYSYDLQVFRYSQASIDFLLVDPDLLLVIPDALQS